MAATLYKTTSPRSFAVDFDGTAAEHSAERDEDGSPRFGAILPWFKRFVDVAKKAGHTVTIFTARSPEQYSSISQHVFEATGYDLPVTSTKLKTFDLIIDDRAVRFYGEDMPDWIFELEPWWRIPVREKNRPSQG